MAHIPFRERIWCSVRDACEVTGDGRTKIFDKVRTGRIVSKKDGARRKLSVRSVLEDAAEPVVASGTKVLEQLDEDAATPASAMSRASSTTQVFRSAE